MSIRSPTGRAGFLVVVAPALEAGVSVNGEASLWRPYETDAEWGPPFTQEEYLNGFFYHGGLVGVRSGAGSWI